MRHVAAIVMWSSDIMNDDIFMQAALEEARLAYQKNEVPVGCVIVVNGEIVARAHNLRHTHKQGLYHAEMIAIHRACKTLKRWILDDATIYVTLEPCLMCSGAILQTRMKRLVYGQKEPKFGCIESVMRVFDQPGFNHMVEVTSGVFANEIEAMMKEFFQNLRKSKKNNKE